MLVRKGILKNHPTSTRRPIIYPSGKIIAHDKRYTHRNILKLKRECD